MSPLRANILKGVSFSALGIAFGFGSAWIDTKRDIAEKVDSRAFEQHVVRESQVDSTLLRLMRQHADADCIGEKNPYKRRLLDCDVRGVK